MNTSNMLVDIMTMVESTNFSVSSVPYAVEIVKAVERPVFKGVEFKDVLVTIGSNIMNINRHGNKSDIEFTYKAYLQFMRICREFGIWVTYDLIDGEFVGRIA